MCMDGEQLFRSQSSTNDEIYNNTISNVGSGIGIINGSIDNEIHHNNVINASNPLRTDVDAKK